MSVYFSVLGKKNDNKISIQSSKNRKLSQKANINFVCNHNLDRDALSNRDCERQEETRRVSVVFVFFICVSIVVVVFFSFVLRLRVKVKTAGAQTTANQSFFGSS